MSDLSNLLKQAQEMQSKMADVQKEIANIEVIGDAGAGMVKVRMNGNHAVLDVILAPTVMDEETDFIQDLIAAAINDAVRKVKDAIKTKMGDVTKGMQLPEGFEMPTGD